MSEYFVNGTKDGVNVKEFDKLDLSVRELILEAVEVRKHAYCPYSNVAVGAAIRTTDGSIYTGCNIENESYTASICAERIAAAKAISEGKREFVALAVVAQQEGSFATPCGVCRQFLAEFASKQDFPIYAAKPISPPFRVLCTSIMELLPKSFV
ncbi:cytidine deaminase [Haematobia irritans]|uniref:cytidine deaminase n=1 Tax=Haematobia irritans TaxID=7368 RepID=UPI003F507426